MSPSAVFLLGYFRGLLERAVRDGTTPLKITAFREPLETADSFVVELASGTELRVTVTAEEPTR